MTYIFLYWLPWLSKFSFRSIFYKNFIYNGEKIPTIYNKVNEVWKFRNRIYNLFFTIIYCIFWPLFNILLIIGGFVLGISTLIW